MVKMNIEDYEEYGLGDIYYGLITFISRYTQEKYNPMEIFENNTSEYAIAVDTLKYSLKEILDYLKNAEQVYLPKLNRNINLQTLNAEEQKALEERCKEYMLLCLNNTMEAYHKDENGSKKSK